MENKLRKIILAVISVVVSISVIAYLTTLPEPILEKPYWYSVVALLFLYWIILINWYSKRKRK